MNTNFKTRPARSKTYLRFIASQPCSVHGCPYNAGAAHHEQIEGHGTMGGKCGDERTICLCLKHHRERHDYGRGIWRKNWGVDPEKVIIQMQTKFLQDGGKKFW